MDARIGRLIVEANEISRCLKKDYVFSTDKTGDSTNSTYVQVTSKSLKINTKISITSFKGKLITLRKLMYEDPSDTNLSQADEIIRSHDELKSLEESTLDQLNGNISQVNLNNCSSSPNSKYHTEDALRAVKITKSEDKCSVNVDGNLTSSVPSNQDAHLRISTNVQVSEPKPSAFRSMEDREQSKEFPRKKSLRKFKVHPEPVGSFNPKMSEPAIPICPEKIDDRPISCKCLQTNLQMFLNGCAMATSTIEKNFQENQIDSHICVKGLQSMSELYGTLSFLEKPLVQRLTPDFEQKCIQAIANLHLLSFIVPQFIGSGEVVDDSRPTTHYNSTELLVSLKDFVSGFSGLWKVISSSSSEQHEDIRKSLLELIHHLGSIFVTSEYPYPLTPKIHLEVKEEFMNGCERAMFMKLENGLSIINQHYNVLESLVNENKDVETKSMLVFKMFSLVRSSKHLLMIIKQIQEELKLLSLVKGNQESTTENIYMHNLNISSASEQMSHHIGVLTKSSSQLLPTAEVTILTLKRISKNVSLVEESSRNLSSSYIHGGMDGIMAQDQLESLSEIQSMIDSDCVSLRSILLDGISFGTSKGSIKADVQPSHLHHSLSVMSRANGKRVLPQTPQGDGSKKCGINQFSSDNRLPKNIGQSPSSRSFHENKCFTLDHCDEVSAFERIDNSIPRLRDELSRTKFGTMEEGKDAFRESMNAFQNHRFRHSFIG